jgi:RHS repeat-associated protein
MGLVATLLALASSLTLPVLASQGDVVEYYHLDGLGTVRAVSDANGDLIASENRDYLPYGEQWCGTGPCSGVPAGQSLRFTGKERDAETGLDYFGARYYGAGIARFTTVDPVYTWQDNLVDPERWNRYAYARDNPLRYVDPDGRSVWTKAIKFVIKGADIAATTAGLVEDAGIVFSGDVRVGTGKRLLHGLSIASELLPVSGRDIKEGVEFVGKALHRPYLRKRTVEKIYEGAPRDVDGRLLDANEFTPIEGTPDVGHKHGYEFRREKAKAEAEGLGQKDFNDRMNNPDYYQLEDPSSNRSHRHEKPGNN